MWWCCFKVKKPPLDDELEFDYTNFDLEEEKNNSFYYKIRNARTL